MYHDILKKATPFSLVIIDELGSATEYKVGVEISRENWIENLYRLNCCVCYTTHMPELPNHFKGTPGIGNLKVELKFEGSIPTYPYKVSEGIEPRSFAKELLEHKGIGLEATKKMVWDRFKSGEIPEKYRRDI